MTTKLFISYILGAALTGAGATEMSAQSDAPDAGSQTRSQTSQVQPALPQQAQPADRDFGLATDKPHAGTPLQADASTPPDAQAQSSPAGTPQWYKDSPQAYDHQAPKAPRHLRPPKTPTLQVYDDTGAAPQEMAQEAPPAQEYDDQPRIQPVPRYYSQQDPQDYPQQNYPQQNYPQQNYPAQPQQGDEAQPYPRQDYPPQDYPQDGDGYPAGQVAQQPLSAQQIEQLVAPIALYPDSLVAQIFTASTYPAQITAANEWLRQMNGASPQQIADGANAQSTWDPSVKALTAFPQVLEMLAGNLQWTTALGNAYYNQPADVLDTVQALRQRADQAGNLQSTPQQQVIQDPGYIQIQPADPQYIYVPSYNPWYAYGAPVAPYPGFAFGNWGLFIGGGVEYGLGFAVAPFFGYGFGFGYWGLNWLGGAVCFHNGSYWTHSHQVQDWGFAHGGPRWSGWSNGGGYRGGNMARFGDYHNQGVPVHPGGSGRQPLGRGFGGPQPYQANPQQRFGFGRPNGGPSRPGTPGQQAYNRMPEAYGRPQPYQGRPQPFGGQTFSGRPQPSPVGPQRYGGGSLPFRSPAQPVRPFGGQPPRLGNGYGQYPRPGQGFAGRPQPLENYRPPRMSYNQPRFGGSMPSARPQQPSGGFHPFSGGHSAPSFGGGGHSFGGGGGGHAFSGGSSHSFGGGGHSFSGGGHSSGGNFGGGGGHHH